MKNHTVKGWNDGVYETHYEVYCTYQGDSVPATYQTHSDEYECGGCCKKLKKLKNKVKGGK